MIFQFTPEAGPIVKPLGGERVGQGCLHRWSLVISGSKMLSDPEGAWYNCDNCHATHVRVPHPPRYSLGERLPL